MSKTQNDKTETPNAGQSKPQEANKTFLASIGDGIVAGFQASGDAIVGGSNAVVGALSESGKFVFDGLSDGVHFVFGGLSKTSNLVVDQVSGALGTIRDGVYYIGDKAVEGTVVVKDGIVSVGENVIGSVLNTGRFLGDSDYRQRVGMPWLKGLVSSNQQVLTYQMQENSRAMQVLYRYLIGDQLTEEETEQATQQLTTMVKLVPALAIFLLPGGMVLLPMLAKVLPWDVVPNLRPPGPLQLSETTETTK